MIVWFSLALFVWESLSFDWKMRKADIDSSKSNRFENRII
jgi:hypothetical protein